MNFLLEAKGRPREVHTWSQLLESGVHLWGLLQAQQHKDKGVRAGKAWAVINTDIHPDPGNKSQLNRGLGAIAGGHTGMILPSAGETKTQVCAV